MDRNAKFIMECDFYGGLLTERQRQVVEMYHGDNLTLAEIAEEFGISRQGVHDALKNGETALNDYEDKLGLVERFRKMEDGIAEINEVMNALEGDMGDNKEVARSVKEVKRLTKEIDHYWAENTISEI